MAMDEAIATAVKKGNSPPTLRLYGWSIPSVSIGYFQRMTDIDIDYCQERGIPIVRRPTGGRAILHDYEITYSFSIKTDSGIFSKGLLDSYEKISKAFSLALSKIGLAPEMKLQREPHRSRSPLCFQSTSYGEITINSKKVIGSAQKRWSDGLLQQGSIPLIIEEEEIAKVFRLKSSETGKKFTGLKKILSDLNTESFKNVIRISFEETFDTSLIPLSPSNEEVSLAGELEVRKYRLSSWNFQR
ncbi:MAG TPA: biotin/lipoate A/B protein ligase family protein [Thermodesulfovibrionales bacterium]|nr:biotin/lipoate A/B protein ligase family protein [Thermodesulfovibrionales bacterium]